MISLETKGVFYVIVVAFYLYVVVSCVILIKRNKTINQNKKEGIMTQEYTRMLKGILAINIIMCHFVARAENLFLPFRILGFLGGPSVASFLCISGYAETYTMVHKGTAQYYNGYLIKKLFRIYFPWLISVLLLALMYGINDVRLISEGLFTFKTIYREGTYNWFVIIILYYYMAIWLYGVIAKHYKWNNTDKRFLLWIFFISALWFVVCYSKKMDLHWYGNSFSMFFGCLIGMYHKQFGEKLNKHKLVNLVIFTVLSIAFFGMSKVFQGSLKVICKLLSNLSICMLTWLFSQLIIEGNKPLEFLGSLSLELFYMGTGVFLWYYYKFPATGWSVIPIFVMIILVAYIIKVITDFSWQKGINLLMQPRDKIRI